LRKALANCIPDLMYANQSEKWQNHRKVVTQNFQSNGAIPMTVGLPDQRVVFIAAC
jgi:hypothetical protein